jgi:hypothetical protein
VSADIETGEVVDPLSDLDFLDREQYETVITSGIGSYLEVGTALSEIKERRLYRDRFVTFAEYVGRMWGLSESRGYQMIDAAVITLEISTVVEAAPDDSPLRLTPIPVNEAQVRELARFKGQPELAAEVLREAEKDGAPTAQKIKAAANVIAPKKAKKKATKTTTIKTETVVESGPAAAADPPPAPKPKAPVERDTVGKQVADRIHTAAVNLTQHRVEQADERTVKQLEAWCKRWMEAQ